MSAAKPLAALGRDAQLLLDQRLADASGEGLAQEALALLSAGANAAASGALAVQKASAHGHVECLGLLISRPLSVKDCSQALASAAHAGHAECVMMLIPLADPSTRGFRAMLLAAESGHAKCVELLAPFCFGAGPQAFIPSLLAAASTGHADCLMILAPALPASSEAIMTALSLACCFGHEACAKVLLPFAGGLLGSDSPLHIALRGGRAGIVSAMLARDLRIAAILREPKILARAKREGHQELALLLGSLAESQALSEASAPASTRSKSSPRL